MDTNSSIAVQKERLRRALQGIGLGLSADREQLSARARSLLIRQEVWRQATTVLLFASLADELDLWPLAELALQSGKRVGFPRFERALKEYSAREVTDLQKDMAPGYYGIREPCPDCAVLQLNPLDLILIPGVAFDLYGRRLGRGRGYYDRLLRRMSGVKCGVALEQQIVPEVPVAPHDVHLNCILTPTRWLSFERSVLE